MGRWPMEAGATRGPKSGRVLAVDQIESRLILFGKKSRGEAAHNDLPCES
jgi:hypothetical protein